MKGGQRGNNPNIAEDGKATRFERGSERAKEAASNAAKKRVQNLNLQKLASKMVNAEPRMSLETKRQLKEKLGLDTEDPEMLTTGAVLLVQILQKAMNGDMDAILRFMEMAGQKVDSRSQNEAERLKIERERLKVERERLAIMKETAKLNGDGAADMLPQIIIQRADTPPKSESKPDNESKVETDGTSDSPSE